MGTERTLFVIYVVFSVAIIELSLVGIVEGIVSDLDALKLPLGVFVARIQVWVITAR